MFGIFASIAEFEGELIRSRVKIAERLGVGDGTVYRTARESARIPPKCARARNEAKGVRAGLASAR